MKKYYRMIVRIGHNGAGRTREVPVYVFAKDMSSAIKRAMNLPAVKHSEIPLTAKEITKEEFEQGRKENLYLKTIDAQKGKHHEESHNLY